MYLLDWDSLQLTTDSLRGEGIKEMDMWHEYYFNGSIPISQIKTIKSSQFDLTATLVLGGVILIFFLGFMLAMSEGFKNWDFKWR